MFLNIGRVLQALDEVVLFFLELGDFTLDFHSLSVLLQNAVD